MKLPGILAALLVLGTVGGRAEAQGVTLNCSSANASCLALNFTTTGTSTANSFTATAASAANAYLMTAGAKLCFDASCTLNFRNNGGTLDYSAGGGVNFGVANVTVGSGATLTAGGNGGGGLALGGNTATLKIVNVADSAATPTISSGFGAGAAVAGSNGTASFTVNTGAASASGVIGLPTATTGWVCFCTDVTTFSATVFLTRQTATSTTTCTVGNFSSAAASQNWVANDILHCIARAR